MCVLRGPGTAPSVLPPGVRGRARGVLRQFVIVGVALATDHCGAEGEGFEGWSIDALIRKREDLRRNERQAETGSHMTGLHCRDCSRLLGR